MEVMRVMFEKSGPGRNLLLGIASAVLLAGCGGSEQSSEMSIQADDKMWIQRDLLATETEDPVVEKIHYDMNGERVYIESRVFPAGKVLTAEDVSNAGVQYFGLGLIGLSREEPETKDQVGAREVGSEHTVVLASRLLRVNGNGEHLQPYGDHVLRTVIEESPYELERTSGLPFFGDVEVEQVGDGNVRFELVNGNGEILFTLRDDYIENSSEYVATFTPDGRYLLITLPDAPETAASQLPGGHRLVLVGDLSINMNKRDIVAELSLTGAEREAYRAKRLLRQRYKTGEISAVEYYGEIYLRAHSKITQCADVEHIAGEISSLVVQDNVLDFGQPETVGKVFTFDYVAESSIGTMSVTVLDPEHHDKWASAYRNYLESVDIRSDSGVRFANCP